MHLTLRYTHWMSRSSTSRSTSHGCTRFSNSLRDRPGASNLDVITWTVPSSPSCGYQPLTREVRTACFRWADVPTLDGTADQVAGMDPRPTRLAMVRASVAMHCTELLRFEVRNGAILLRP